MEEKARNRLIIIIASILVMVVVFLLLFFHVKASNYKYHRKLFGNHKTYIMVEKKVFEGLNNSIADLVDYGGLSSVDKEDMVSSLELLEDVYFSSIEDVKYERSEIFYEDKPIEVDLYQTNIRMDKFLKFAKETIDLLKEDGNFYYLSKGLEEYDFFEDEFKDIDNEEDWISYLDRKWDGIKDIEDFRLFHLVNFDDDRETVNRFINISSGGDIVFRLVYDNYKIGEESEAELRITYKDKEYIMEFE